MKIERVRVNPFGSIVEKELEFIDGLNVILGPNEAGKSTVFHAIQHVLFTPSELTQSKFDSLLQKYVPIGGGDTIHVELGFRHDNQQYTLKKTWGKKSSSELKLPDGLLIRNDDTIQQRLEPILRAKEGTYRSVLMTYQTGLGDTLYDLKTKYIETVHTLGDILRRSFLETDGVSVDSFKENVRSLYDEYANHWDFKQQKPEKGKRYKKKVGLILDAFYHRQDIEFALNQAVEHEEKLDSLNQNLRQLSSEIKEKERYIEENSKIVEAARKRQGLEKDLMLSENEIKTLKEANSRWPVFESKIVEIDKSLVDLERRKQSLEKEKKEAEIQEINRTLLEKYARAQKRKIKLVEAEETVSKIAKLTREDLDSIQKACFDLKSLETSLASGKLSLDVKAKKDISLFIQKDSEPKSTREVRKGQKIKVDAGSRIVVEHADFTMEIQSGEGTVDDLIQSIEDARKKCNDLFSHYEIDSYEKAKEINKIYEKAIQEVEARRKSLFDELGEENFDELESKVKTLKPEKKVTPLTDIIAGLTDVKNSIVNLNKERAEAKQTIAKFEAEYRDHDVLLEKLAEIMKKKNTVSEELATLSTLPTGIEDAETYINQYESSIRQKDDLNKREKEMLLERAHLERNAPELSSEEFTKQLFHASEVFDSVLQKGIAIKQILDLTDSIVEKFDASTYLGIEKKLEDYITLITAGRYKKIKMDESLPGGFLREDGALLPSDLFSTGTRDMLALAVRLSMAEYFLQDSEGFLMMDDPLVNLDPERQKKAAEAIRVFSTERQVLLFSCHPSHAELLGGNVIGI
jgi:exonuclease SbcC